MRTALIVPAYNEELTIEAVVRGFHAVLPEAELWVVDNASSDATGSIAAATLADLGASGDVLFEPRRGKSFALRRAFAHVDADLYVMTDADLTYSADDLPALMAPVLRGEADMAVGDRLVRGDYDKSTQRRFHAFGNRLVRLLINFLFRSNLNDIMSGYRVMNRRFVKLLPLISGGFEVETEISIHALDKRFLVAEVPISYAPRPQGSTSKLSTLRDGWRIVLTVLKLFKDYHPFKFFMAWSVLFFLVGLGIGILPILEFLDSGYVYRVPSAILATGLMILSFLMLSLAIIMDTIVNFHRREFEHKYLNFNTVRHPGVAPGRTLSQDLSPPVGSP